MKIRCWSECLKALIFTAPISNSLLPSLSWPTLQYYVLKVTPAGYILVPMIKEYWYGPGSKQWTAVNQKSGLTCDYIYSLLRDRNGNIWVGTGCGIDKITLRKKDIVSGVLGKSDGLLGVENYCQCLLRRPRGYPGLFTKGVFPRFTTHM